MASTAENMRMCHTSDSFRYWQETPHGVFSTRLRLSRSHLDGCRMQGSEKAGGFRNVFWAGTRLFRNGRLNGEIDWIFDHGAQGGPLNWRDALPGM